MGLIDGLRDVAIGVSNIVIGVGKAVFAFLKMMLFGVVLVIVGVYSAITGMFNYAKSAWKRLREQRPKVKPKSGGSATAKVMTAVLNGIDKEIADGTLNLSDLEKEEVKSDVESLKDKLNSGEANGMHFIEGLNEFGQTEVLDAQLFKAKEFDGESQRRDNEGKIFIQKFS